jgi:hypothetical protein
LEFNCIETEKMINMPIANYSSQWGGDYEIHYPSLAVFRQSGEVKIFMDYQIRNTGCQSMLLTAMLPFSTPTIKGLLAGWTSGEFDSARPMAS